ncbi:MAG: 30S ribosomal protein S15 [Planctomycetota bacterium]
MMTKERKTEIVGEFRTHEKDSGSSQIQVAILSDRIHSLTKHLSVHKKDFATRRGLLMLVGHRKRLLNYLRKNNYAAYIDITTRLGIRRQAESPHR